MALPPTQLRLLLVCAFLPLVVGAVDSAVLSMAGSSHWSGEMTFGVLALFLVQASAVSYAAGRWLPNWNWRLLLLGWLTLRVDLLLYSTSVVSHSDYGVRSELLVVGFYASQVSLAIIWGILGSLEWRRRLAGAALAAAPALQFLLQINAERRYSTAAWLTVALVQAIGVVGICGLMRVLGYRIDNGPDTRSDGAALQFTIGHMLVWTVAAAIIVSVARQVGMYAPGQYGLREWMQLIIAGTVLAIVALVAMWMVLGAGRGIVTTVIALAIAASAGAFLWYLESRIAKGGTAYWLPFGGDWWLGWTLLAEPFLAGLLLVFSATGYRLVWRRRIGGSA
ncbi:MAG TPA: hypothetical protein VHC22_23235 [Pirellulales bacterium]|nr:hypothetical protein [Pirellulales bacterium]